MPSERFRVTVPDTRYWQDQICCQAACPVHTDARGYVRAVAEGDYERAYLLARGPNPLASICGRICGAPCEVNCRRRNIDSPIAIRALKRFVTSGVGPESQAASGPAFWEHLRGQIKPGACSGLEELQALLSFLNTAEFPKPSGAPIGIVGAGPAGLAAAHDLALMGFRPTIFEMEPVPAGMLYLGVPVYRLPRELIRAEVAVIESLGVEIRCNVQVGRDISFADLRRDFAAVIVAVGAKRSRGLAIPGADAEGVHTGVDFLRAVALNRPISLGTTVVVIGGGNVAYDVARTVVRQEEADVARSAARLASVREVHLCCLESREEMVADEVEVAEGEEEGIVRHNGVGPVEILTADIGGRKVVRAVLFRKCLSVYDQQKRFAPKYDDEARVVLGTDSVLLSVGQEADLSFIDPQADGIEIGAGGRVRLDPEGIASTASGVFFAGDVAHGPRLMIDAIASGKKAARSVYRFWTGKEAKPSEVEFHFPIEDYRRERGYENRSRVSIPTADVQLRLRDSRVSVEKGYTEEQARREASRCLDCGVNTIFNSEKCVLCGGCADVCPSLCLRLVSVDRLEPSPELALLIACYGAETAGEVSAIIKDEDRCIRCGLCAERCPTGSITMERFLFRKEWQTCQRPPAAQSGGGTSLAGAP